MTRYFYVKAVELNGNSTENIDENQLFTGSFSHSNIDIALKSITLPLHLKYSKTNNTITLKRD